MTPTIPSITRRWYVEEYPPVGNERFPAIYYGERPERTRSESQRAFAYGPVEIPDDIPRGTPLRLIGELLRGRESAQDEPMCDPSTSSGN